ncbi:transmembrane protein 255B [Erpetoichthys calabaricus]|uniref:transmembrane protein 255B n=1 Tax=Erpetoichthys calabaricus TaxID=27687 RepID=UPI0022342242|nr:transmembrane protein 255B [Erpetoichthys calabaricus]
MQAPPLPGSLTMLDPAGQFSKRKRTALWFTVSLLVLSFVILVVGVTSATRTGNVAVAGYYPGIILSFGSFLGVVGINLVENRRPMLVASIVFISIGVIAAFFCAIVDGVIAAEYIDPRPLSEGRCKFYAGSLEYSYENYYTKVTCYNQSTACQMKVRSNTCYCCDLYNCDNPEHFTEFYEFTAVKRCMDVTHLYRLLWASVVLNILSLFLGIVTAAILGAFKDMAASSQLLFSQAPPPHILYNPAQQMMTYTGFCAPTQALPAYPNYSLPHQHHTPLQAPSPTESSAIDDHQPIPQSSSGCSLSPNAPTLITQAYNQADKPPPYAS